MSIYDDIYTKKYQPKISYPTSPKKPTILNKKVNELTDEEIVSIPQIKKDYEKELEEFKQKQEEYRKHDSELTTQFWEDLREEMGLDKNNLFVQKMEYIAYQRGHSGGFQDIVSEMYNLMPLYELYQIK